MNSIPTLSDGEIYVATIQIAGETPYHLILLPDHSEGAMTHQAATEWAANIGGDLPTRPEQTLLFAHQRDEFDRDWYWSNMLLGVDQDYAWCQYFGYGSRATATASSNKLRARSARREFF